MANIKRALDDFIRIAASKEIANAAKTTVRGFTQTRKISLQDVLLFYTFRSCETTNKDISLLFSKMDKEKVSKQGMFKALNKTNPEVFPLMIRMFAKSFYDHQDYKTMDGYIVLACDGSKMDLPPSQVMKDEFGGYLNQKIKDKSSVKKPQANCSILVDVLNHVVLDAMVKPCATSELPMLYEHLENCKELLKDKKVILLCDRYYGSAELFLYCALHGYRYLVRAKSYMYKHQVCDIERDGDIRLEFDKAWLRRLKRNDCRELASTLPELNIRVVKNHYEYFLSGRKQKREPIVIDSVYMTDLNRTAFSTECIVELYHVNRWDNETAYFDIKTHLEAERFNSGKYNIVVNELLGKILCYSICGIIYNRIEEIVIEKHSHGESATIYQYIPNMKYICDSVRIEHNFIRCVAGILTDKALLNAYLMQLEDDCSRNVVPVRPGRHYKRWGRWMSTLPTSKFRVDGRRNPPIQRCFKANGYKTVQK